jgi:cysteine desulfurase
MARHYLDHASTSPARPEVVEAMLPWLTGDGAGDPGRVHTEGRMARVAIEEAREQVAALVGARPRQVVFTSGATEAINAVSWGVGGPVACARVEHSAVRDSAARRQVVDLAVDRRGRIEVESVREALDRGVRLVHCQWGNHEVGTVQPVAEVIALCRERGVLVHVDAAQAVGHVPVSFEADLMSVSAHKFGGPKGIGALLVRRGLRIDPFVVGGEQERARRAGMENVPAIVGFGAAASAVQVEAESARQRGLVRRVVEAASAVDGVSRYGDPDEAGSLPHLACFAVEGVEAEPVLLGLDQAGVAAHSGSACSSESLEPSPVLEAMGVEAERSLRVSVGWSTTEADVDAFADAFPRVVARLRALAS